MSYTAEIEQVSYQDPSVNSDKFYAAYVLSDPAAGDHRVLFQWGRRGSEGQKQVRVANSLAEAQAIADRKIHEKRAKGYGENMPTDGHRALKKVPSDILADAGVNVDAQPYKLTPAPVGSDETPAAVMVHDFAAEVDRAMRLSYGTPAKQAEAVQIRAGLKSKLDSLREATATCEGAFEVLDDVLYARMEASA